MPIACVSNPYADQVAVTGLAGSGLVLQNNASDNLNVPGNGTHTFATPIKSGLDLRGHGAVAADRTVADLHRHVARRPVAGGPVTLAVNCVTNTYTVSGTVTGLNGTGLVLRNNGGDNKSISANGAFTFATPVASGATYAVTVPPSRRRRRRAASSAAAPAPSAPARSPA